MIDPDKWRVEDDLLEEFDVLPSRLPDPEFDRLARAALDAESER